MSSSSASCSASKGLHAKYRPPTSIVGTVRLPLFALMTISSPEGSSSISTSRKLTPRSFKKDFARRQSGHQVVLYIVMGCIGLYHSIRRGWQGEVARSRASDSGEDASCAGNESAALLGAHLDAD